MKPNFLHSLWERIKKQIKKTGNTEGRDADDDQNPPPTLPPYRYRARQHHLTAQEKQHRAAEQSYWQEQLRLAKELNVLTGTLNYITEWATGIAVLTVGIGAVGLVGLYLTFKEAREANKIAWDALTDARETTKLDKRAWVGVGEVTALGELTPGKPLGVRAVVGNSGESPAVHASVYGELSFLGSAVGDQRIPLSWNAGYLPCKGDKPQWDTVVGGAIILPGANTGNLNRVSQPVSKEYIELIRKEKLGVGAPQDHSQELRMIPFAPETSPTAPQHMGLFFVGCVNYFDVFREAHRTTFCFEYAYSQELAAAFPKGAFIACARGNEAD